MADISYELRDGYGVVRLERGHKRNALTLDIAAELAAALDRAGREPTSRAVVLTGSDGSFSAGADRSMLAELTRMSGEQIARHVYGVFQGLVRAIVHAPIPVVALVDGPALGAGCDLALACDCRVVTPRARFEETWIRLGLVPGMGGMALLTPLVGLGRARAMLYRAEPVDGTQAVQMGLAEALVSTQHQTEELEAWLRPILDHDRSALEWIKIGSRRSAMRLLEDDLEFASSHQALRITAPDIASALRGLATSPGASN